MERHSRSMKMLSMKRPRPSIEIATPAVTSLLVSRRSPSIKVRYLRSLTPSGRERDGMHRRDDSACDGIDTFAQYRHFATRYEKNHTNSLAALKLVCVHLRLRSYQSTTSTG